MESQPFRPNQNQRSAPGWGFSWGSISRRWGRPSPIAGYSATAWKARNPPRSCASSRDHTTGDYQRAFPPPNQRMESEKEPGCWPEVRLGESRRAHDEDGGGGAGHLDRGAGGRRGRGFRRGHAHAAAAGRCSCDRGRERGKRQRQRQRRTAAEGKQAPRTRTHSCRCHGLLIDSLEASRTCIFF